MPLSLSDRLAVRIAPSPTGAFHIGTARTALFNYLYAKSNDGQFRLRIEDTDRVRSSPESVEDILEGLAWLGLLVDGEVVYQSQRHEAYPKALEDLKTQGVAYEKGGAWWFATEQAKAQRMEIVFDDLIRGPIHTPIKEIDDFVLVRSDGSPLFLFVGVVDDAAMGITHVIRGEDHISNTPRQILIAEALGFSIPRYAHLPLILAPDRTKLSKRHGAISLVEYRRKGYLPQAMVNFLVLLGWHPEGDQEIFTLDELVKTFSLERIQKSGAVFDEQKLISINRQYLKDLPVEELIKHLKPLTSHPDDEEKLKLGLELVRERLNTLAEFDSQTTFLWERPTPDQKLLIFKRSTGDQTLRGLKLVKQKIEGFEQGNWRNDQLKKLLEKIVSLNKLGNGDVFWPVRVALSGQEASPSPEELLVALGQEESIIRIRAAIERLVPE